MKNFNSPSSQFLLLLILSSLLLPSISQIQAQAIPNDSTSSIQAEYQKELISSPTTNLLTTNYNLPPSLTDSYQRGFNTGSTTNFFAQSLDDQAYLNNFKVAEKSLNDLKLEEGKKLAEKQVELVKMEKFKKDKEEMRETAKTLTSIFISLPPVIGEGYDTLTLFQGKDPITGEKLTSFTKTLTILGLASGVGSEYFIHFI